MATEPKQPKPEQEEPERKTQQEGESQQPTKASEAKEGMPGYGQPEEEVRDKFIPEQKW